MKWLPAILGAAALVFLFAGAWQIRERQATDARIASAAQALDAMPGAMPDVPDPVRDLFRPVRVAGAFAGEPVFVGTDHSQMGPGFRVVQPFDVAGRRILMDRGFIYEAWKDAPLTATEVEVNGNLDWPEDLGQLVRDSGTAPVMVVAATPTGDGIMPIPVDPGLMPNRHGAMALVCFGIAAFLTGMTLLAQRRIKRRDEGSVTQ